MSTSSTERTQAERRLPPGTRHIAEILRRNSTDRAEVAAARLRIPAVSNIFHVRQLDSDRSHRVFEYLRKRLNLCVYDLIASLVQGTAGEASSEQSVQSALRAYEAVVTEFVTQNCRDATVLTYGLETFIASITQGIAVAEQLDPNKKDRFIRISQRLLSLYDWLVFRSPLITTVRTHHTQGEKDTANVAGFRNTAILGLVDAPFMLLANTVSSTYAAQPIGGEQAAAVATSAFSDKEVYLSPQMRNLLTFVLRLHPIAAFGRGEMSAEDAMTALEKGVSALLDTQEKFSEGLFDKPVNQTTAYKTFIQVLVAFMTVLDTNAVVHFSQSFTRNSGRFSKELYAKWGDLAAILGSRSALNPRVNFASLSTGGEPVPYADGMQAIADHQLNTLELFNFDKPSTLIDLLAALQELVRSRGISLAQLKGAHVRSYSKRRPEETGQPEQGSLEQLYMRLLNGVENGFNKYFTQPAAERETNVFKGSAAFCYMELYFMVELLTPKIDGYIPTTQDAESPDWPKQFGRRKLSRLIVSIYQRESDPVVRKQVIGAVLQHIFAFWPAEEVGQLSRLYLGAAFQDPERLVLREDVIFDWFFRLSTESSALLYNPGDRTTQRAEQPEIAEANISVVLELLKNLPELTGTGAQQRISLLATLAHGTSWQTTFSQPRFETSGTGTLSQGMQSYHQVEVVPLRANIEHAQTIKELLHQIYNICTWLTSGDPAKQKEVLSQCATVLVDLTTAEVATLVPGEVPLQWESIIKNEVDSTARLIAAETARNQSLTDRILAELPAVFDRLRDMRAQLADIVLQLTTQASHAIIPPTVLDGLQAVNTALTENRSAGLITSVPTEQLSEENRATALVVQHSHLQTSFGYVAQMARTLHEALGQTHAQIDARFAKQVDAILELVEAHQAAVLDPVSKDVSQFLAFVDRKKQLEANLQARITEYLLVQQAHKSECSQIEHTLRVAQLQLLQLSLPPAIFAEVSFASEPRGSVVTEAATVASEDSTAVQPQLRVRDTRQIPLLEQDVPEVTPVSAAATVSVQN